MVLKMMKLGWFISSNAITADAIFHIQLSSTITYLQATQLNKLPALLMKQFVLLVP